MQMTCPKCHGEMRVYERSGVTVDQCTECRGIFLDRGELEKLFEAEANWNSRQAAPATPPRPAQAPGGYAPPPPPPPGGGYAAPPPPQPGYGQPAYPPAAAAYGAPQYGHGGGYHGHYRHGHGGYHGHYRRRKSFLGELFD
ncbi:zf-TFIIB domain-containing protein [Couchioplanes caeruleus]|uniref:TFIIB-type zinc ribbon-containing protein n=1 Tax=Couchioplanes caeruleus TaxID=56438 RepID=UPI0020BF0B97|nr:zf-TFIIB domain-containing protein [Couchioplanes caeruleus]UQU65010.1 zf-TFIIB domain-containing protein [Couchioplanes caeruleus]